MSTRNIKRDFLESRAAILAEYITEQIDLGLFSSMQEQVSELCDTIRRFGFKIKTVEEMNMAVQQIEMPQDVVVNNIHIGLQEWLFTKDHMIRVSWIEDLWRKCLVFGGLEVSPILLFEIWSDYSSSLFAGWIDSEYLPADEVYDIVTEKLQEMNKNAE